MSFSGCPEFTRNVRVVADGIVDELEVWVRSKPEAIWRYVGFVSHVNVEYEDAAPNMARGKDC